VQNNTIYGGCKHFFEKKLSAGFPPEKRVYGLAAEDFGRIGEQVFWVDVNNFRRNGRLGDCGLRIGRKKAQKAQNKITLIDLD
jgi:hypothetical protein